MVVPVGVLHVSTTIHNVEDRRSHKIGSWTVEPLAYDLLKETDVGRIIIYSGRRKYEAGTLASWRDGIVFVNFDMGTTAAGCRPGDLHFGIEERL